MSLRVGTLWLILACGVVIERSPLLVEMGCAGRWLLTKLGEAGGRVEAVEYNTHA